MRAIALALLLCWGLVFQALAQEVAPDAAANAQARAQAIIDAAHVGDLFAPAPNPSMPQFPRVRHSASGLICVFSPQLAGEISIFPSGLPRGDDVGCNMTTSFDQQSLYATRVNGLSLDADFEMALTALRQRFPNARPFSAGGPVALPVFAVEGVERRRASFLADGQFTHVSLAHVGDWAIKLRLSGPAPAAEMLDNRADLAFWQAVRAMLETPVEAGRGATEQQPSPTPDAPDAR